MKVAIATEGNAVSMHFGRCSGYTIFDVQDGKVESKSFESSPEHQPGMMPKWLNEKGANVVIAGGAGPMAQNLFGQLGIELILGAAGPIDAVIEEYLKGEVKPGESMCDNSGTCDH
ncbi:MAG: NifB/NifX family molybdenum-iron cluster-binding protein [Elusimicrobiota bacterium]